MLDYHDLEAGMVIADGVGNELRVVGWNEEGCWMLDDEYKAKIVKEEHWIEDPSIHVSRWM